MSYSLGQIGYFQLSNLVRNKVPFTLMVLDFVPPQESLPKEMAKLLQMAVFSSAADVGTKIAEMSLRADNPLVLMCKNGEISSHVNAQLIEKGFLNVFVVKGGWDALCAEGA